MAQITEMSPMAALPGMVHSYTGKALPPPLPAVAYHKVFHVKSVPQPAAKWYYMVPLAWSLIRFVR